MSPIVTSPHIWKTTKIVNGVCCSSWLAVTFRRLVANFCKHVCLTACPSMGKKMLCPCLLWDGEDIPNKMLDTH